MLRLEFVEELRTKDLYRHRPTELLVRREVDNSHRPRTQTHLQFIAVGNQTPDKKNARAAMSQALATGDQGAVLEALANLVVEDPLHWRRLNILVDWVPEDSSEPNSIFLKDVLQSISEELAARGQQSVSEN